jgi:CxxC-x17-CxxC domain-containing protein
MKDFRRQNGQGSRGGNNDGFERREQSNDSRPPRRDFDNRGGEKFKGSRNDGSMHKAVCSDCSRSCEVPFAPSGNKPVYCSDCFGKKKGSHSGGYEKRDFAPRGPVAHEARPQQNVPQARDTRIDELKAQVDAMHSKIDRMMKMLMDNTSAPVAKFVSAVKAQEQKAVAFVKKEEKKVVAATKKAVVKVAKKVIEKAKPAKKGKK